MPMKKDDGRKLSWEKFFVEMRGKISNDPQSEQDCWLVACGASDTGGYPMKKIAGAGERNKRSLHRLLWSMGNPGALGADAAWPPTKTRVLVHRCGKGRADFANGDSKACVNPALGSFAHINQSASGRGANGEFLPCRNAPAMVVPCICAHGRGWPAPAPAPAAGAAGPVVVVLDDDEEHF